MNIPNHIKTTVGKLTPRQRQAATVAMIGGVGFSLLWLTFTLSEANSGKPPPLPPQAQVSNGPVTHIAVPGGPVSPQDEWLGTAGKKLSQYDADRLAQEKLNAELQARLAVIEKTAAAQSERTPAPSTTSPALAPAAPIGMPPGTPNGLPPGMPPLPTAGLPAGAPSLPPPEPEPEAPPIMRINITPPKASATAEQQKGAGGKTMLPPTYLPVGFVRGVMIGGIDAPTGGQAQADPLPVFIQLTDNAFLPNRYRAQIKGCFVLGAGYGKLSDERAYIRTISLTCVRHDGTRLEVDLKGNVYGEDGTLGLRGKLVTKQGQALANALRAGVVSGIGQGFAQAGTTVTGTAMGMMTSQGGGAGQAMERGMGRGVGSAMDKLADYYMRMAEQMHPIIEIGGMRKVDVLITSGVDIGPALGSVDEDDLAEARGAR